MSKVIRLRVAGLGCDFVARGQEEGSKGKSSSIPCPCFRQGASATGQIRSRDVTSLSLFRSSYRLI
jgi:hypothetical protein